MPAHPLVVYERSVGPSAFLEITRMAFSGLTRISQYEFGRKVFTGCESTPRCWRSVRSFGVRQLAAAFLCASLLAGTSTWGAIPRQQAGSRQSGSKLPHSKASLRIPAQGVR